jgi:hypothetical protein
MDAVLPRGLWQWRELQPLRLEHPDRHFVGHRPAVPSPARNIASGIDSAATGVVNRPNEPIDFLGRGGHINMLI